MFLTSSSTQTDSCTFPYIPFNPDRLFETDSDLSFFHWILWRYVVVQSDGGFYVMYIICFEMSAFVTFAQKLHQICNSRYSIIHAVPVHPR